MMTSNHLAPSILAMFVLVAGTVAGCEQNRNTTVGRLSPPLSITVDRTVLERRKGQSGQELIRWKARYVLKPAGNRSVIVRVPPIGMFMTGGDGEQLSILGDRLSDDWASSFGPPRDVRLESGSELVVESEFSRVLTGHSDTSFPREEFIFGLPESIVDSYEIVIGNQPIRPSE